MHVADSFNWINAILEVQTAPDGPLSSPFAGQLYAEIEGYLFACAKRWAETKGINYEPKDLVAIGVEHLFDQICKFDPPECESEGVEKAFKVWVATCCRRHWSYVFFSTNAPNIDYVDPDHLPEIENPAPDSESFARSEKDSTTRKAILYEELSKLPLPMQEALLATADAKNASNPGSRVEQGLTKSIAMQHGYTAGAVKTQMSRLKKKVLERWESGK